MKKFKLNIVHFLLVTALIFVLPVLKEWNMLLNGDRVEGIVLETKKDTVGANLLFAGVETRSVIEYRYKEKSYTIDGPENLTFEKGQKIPLIIHPTKENKVIIANLAGFYIHKRSIALVIVFVLWIAIYSTIVQSQRGTIYKRK
ncbi:MAG: hypothetical protein WD052_05225 [Bacteroidales bacterium]